MKFLKKINCKQLILLALCCLKSIAVKSQTETDGLMMQKNEFCIAGIYANNNWTNYWEGTLKRDNANIGKISSNEYHLMGTYGITNKLNVLFNGSVSLSV